MTLPQQFILSDLLKHHVRCDQGLNHGIGLIGWMHPPVHRLLGWFSKPSNFRLTRSVWRLDQLKGIGTQEVYVKGLPVNTEQSTIDRLPTLLNADVLNSNGKKLGSVVDLVFNPKTGKIFHYLLSRSDPRIPGTSRWRLLIDNILDQQPGMVSINLKSLDDLPIAKASIKQDFLRRSRNWRDQIQEFSDQASDRLEGWIEEPPWEERNNTDLQNRQNITSDPLDGWDVDQLQNQDFNDDLESSNKFGYRERPVKRLDDEEDPWI